MSAPIGVESVKARRYLLGQASEEERAALEDDYSSNDDTLDAISAVEDELIEDYLASRLGPDDRLHFERSYLAHPDHRLRVNTVRRLMAAANVSSVSTKRPKRFLPPWAMAAAVLLVGLAAGVLYVQNRRLRAEIGRTQEATAALSAQQQVLRDELQTQRSAETTLREELERLRGSLQGRSPLSAITVLLLPQTRSAGSMATVVVSSGATEVLAQLQFELHEFPTYEAALRDSRTEAVIWRSGVLRAVADANRQWVSVTIPSSLLQPQNYEFELSGRRERGASTVVGSYPFRVTRQ